MDHVNSTESPQAVAGEDFEIESFTALSRAKVEEILEPAEAMGTEGSSVNWEQTRIVECCCELF